MIKKLVVVFFILNSITNWAQQNLVPNYSFEDYSSCPDNTGQIARAINWFQPNYGDTDPNGSSDYYNACNYPGFPNIPYCIGYQFPKTGNGLAGINLFFDTVNASQPDIGREYIEIGLNDSLEFGKKYCIRFHTVKGNWSYWAIKNIQAVLTNDSLFYYDSNWGYIPNQMIILEADSIIKDTLNWIPVQTVYIANGGERFLTIGNFSSGENTVHQLVLPHNTAPNSLGYYFIDDVSVYELPDYNAGNDTTICPWDTIVIGPQNLRGDVQYNWSPTAGLSNPNIANPNASPLVNTTYILTVTDTCQWACNSILMDTINISVQGCLGVKQLEIEHLKFEIYPNPAGDVVFIEAENKTSFGKGVVEIYNINGEFLHNFKLNEGVNRVEIDLTSYQNGVYVFKVIVDGETTEVKRLVITK